MVVKRCAQKSGVARINRGVYATWNAAFTQIAEEEAGVVDIQQILSRRQRHRRVLVHLRSTGRAIQWSKSRSNVNEIASVPAMRPSTYTAQLADDAAKVLNRTELPIGRCAERVRP